MIYGADINSGQKCPNDLDDEFHLLLANISPRNESHGYPHANVINYDKLFKGFDFNALKDFRTFIEYQGSGEINVLGVLSFPIRLNCFARFSRIFIDAKINLPVENNLTKLS